jgi:hypothetical protein
MKSRSSANRACLAKHGGWDLGSQTGSVGCPAGHHHQAGDGDEKSSGNHGFRCTLEPTWAADQEEHRGERPDHQRGCGESQHNRRAGTGGPVLMPWLHSIGGLLEAWYPGEQDGSALAALLFGDFDPSGHLTETFPARASQLPIRTEAQWPGVSEQGGSGGPHSTYSEGLLVGYRWYQAKHIRPLFPFGFGLSYTSFAYSGLRVRAGGGRVHVSFTITNTGRRAGADVAQVYIGDPRSAGEPPEQL